jgi:hypothetical protein
MQSVLDAFMSEANVCRIRDSLEKEINLLRPESHPVSIPIEKGLESHIRRFIMKRILRTQEPEMVDMATTRHECVRDLFAHIAPGMRQERAFRTTVDEHLRNGIGYGNKRQHPSVHMRLPESVARPTHTVLSSYALSRPVMRDDDF